MGDGPSMQRCGVSIFNSGTITIARTKSLSFKAVQEFTGNVLIPIAKRILDVKPFELSNATESSIKCKQCEKLFVLEDELRKHIGVEHILLNEDEGESAFMELI